MAEFRRAFVCGHPISHSRSPLIHGHWLREFGLSGSYDKIDVAPADFAAFLGGLPGSGFCGGNITIPHKEAAFRLIGNNDEASESIGAVNTVWIEDGRLRATNTDWSGFRDNLDGGAPEWRDGSTAVLLGAGGAARAIVYALVEQGYRDIRIVNRTKARSEELANRFGPRASPHSWEALAEALAGANLLVNTTSLGMDGGDGPEIDLSPLPPTTIVTDIVYIPLVTPLLRQASRRGLTTVDGLGMLLHQAVPGFQHWFGTRPTVTDELRSLVIADMETA